MMEVFLDKKNLNEKELGEITSKLINSGWKKFGNFDSTVFFKDITKQEAYTELKNLNLDIEANEWLEDMWEKNYVF